MFTTCPSLLQRLRSSQSDAAWETFVDLYTPLLFAWTNRLGLTQQDGADLLQDLFVVLVEQLPSFQYDAGRSFRAWLKTLLLNRWRDQQRRRKNRSLVDADLAILSVSDAPPEFEEEEYRRHLVARILRLMQAEFPEVTWKACWEYVVRERPPDEVASELGMSVNSVYLAKSRVVRRLREELDGLL